MSFCDLFLHRREKMAISHETESALQDIRSQSDQFPLDTFLFYLQFTDLFQWGMLSN